MSKHVLANLDFESLSADNKLLPLAVFDRKNVELPLWSPACVAFDSTT